MGLWEIFVEVAGWAGVALIIGAYALLSWKLIKQGLLYQVMNLIGAIGLALPALAKDNHQTVVVQIVWALIALVALLRMGKTPPPQD